MNCREGDLAEIIRSECGNEGRRVAVERLNHCGCCWIVQPLQPLRYRITLGPFTLEEGTTMRKGAYPDAWLRPIRDPDPDTSVDEGADLGSKVLEKV